MSDSIELHVDKVQKRLKKLVSFLDNDISTGKEARELHDFVQDELMPVLVFLATDIRTLAEVVMEHDESIAELGPDPSMTMILPEHAQEIVEHIEACNQLLEQMVDNIKQSNVDATPLKQRIEKGKALVDFINSVTLNDEDSENEDDSGETDDVNEP